MECGAGGTNWESLQCSLCPGELRLHWRGGQIYELDISDPSRPQAMGKALLPGIVAGIYVEGFYAYVADGYAGLGMIDVSTPSAPRA